MMQRILLLGLLGTAFAHPAHVSKTWKPNKLSKRVVDLEQYRLSTNVSYINATATTSDPVVKLLKRDSYIDTATALVQRSIPDAEFRVADSYVGTNGVAVSDYGRHHSLSRFWLTLDYEACVLQTNCLWPRHR